MPAFSIRHYVDYVFHISLPSAVLNVPMHASAFDLSLYADYALFNHFT